MFLTRTFPSWRAVVRINKSRIRVGFDTNLNRSNQKASIPFRPDIEVLRALAVGLVIASHAGLPFMPGGFVGVDFFSFCPAI